MTESYLFDFDGTLADTEESIYAAVARTLMEFRGILPDREELRRINGGIIRDTFEKQYGIRGSELPLAIKRYRAVYSEIAPDLVTLYPGVRETMKKLHDSGHPLFVVSNKGREQLAGLLRHLGIAPLLSCVIGEQDVVKKKPDPEGVDRIVEKFGIRKSGALVVGDTVYDIRMGKNAGCPTCGVTYGFGAREQLAGENADFLIDSFPALLPLKTAG